MRILLLLVILLTMNQKAIVETIERPIIQKRKVIYHDGFYYARVYMNPENLCEGYFYMKSRKKIPTVQNSVETGWIASSCPREDYSDLR